jgi:AbiV family abortive infection protein
MKKSKQVRIRPQFKGRLTLKQIAEGMTAAQKNALALLDDARILFAARRFSSASFMAITAIEEYGKLPILSSMTFTPDSDLKKRWEAYRDHRSKNSRWVLPEFVDSEPRTIEELASITRREAEHTKNLDELKQLCLYTDCLEGVKWSQPDDLPSTSPERLASYLLSAAQRIISAKPFSEEFLGLEEKHLSRLGEAPLAERKLAIAALLREAREKGIAPLSESFLSNLLYGRVDLSGT